MIINVQIDENIQYYSLASKTTSLLFRMNLPITEMKYYFIRSIKIPVPPTFWHFWENVNWKITPVSS